MITDQYNQMTQLPSRESLFGTGQPPASGQQPTQATLQTPGQSPVQSQASSLGAMANPSGMPNGVVPTQMQTPQEQAMMQQQQSVYGEFEQVLMGMFGLAQSYPQFNSPLAAMAQQMQAMMQQVAAEASEQRIPQSLS